MNNIHGTRFRLPANNLAERLAQFARQLVLCGALVSLLGANGAFGQTPENKAEVFELPTVNVVATTPLPGLGVPLEDVPANVQIIKGAAIGDQHEINLTGFLEHNVNNVNINSEQGNADQQSVMFRGFYASPILGVAQGISVFQDGVRVNESFGDVVNWDLLPATAISSMQLIPGSNPLFGLNTLGGALAINTKTGKEYPGLSMSLSAGSFNRRQVDVEYGGVAGNWDYFFTANDTNTQGYATQSLSHVRQMFGKVGWSDDQTDIDLSLTLADNYLQGNQTLPVAMLTNLRQAYTYPDYNRNELVFLTLKGTHFLGESLLLGGTAYFRDADNFGLDSNTTGGPYNTPTCAIDPGPPGANGNPALAGGDNCSASNVFQHLIQNTYGGGLQLTSTEKWLGMNNQLVAGFTADLSNGGFNQGAQDAYFDASRNTVGVDNVAQNVLLKTGTRYYGVFASDSLQLTPRWTLTGSARFNADQVLMFDQLGTALNGSHRFSRLDPAFGVNFKPVSDVVVYTGYSQGMRVPSPIELSCANAQAPCSLPNAFSSDPGLKMVTTQTWELGSRFKIGTWTHVQLAAYQTRSQNDINFVTDAASPTQGYFANVGATRRRGVEFASQTVFPRWNLQTAYSYNQAIYQSSFALISPNNISADANGVIQVAPGDRIPNVPNQSLKLRLEFTPNPRWRIGVNMNAYGNMYSRGNENNLDPAGRVAGYAVFNLDATIALNKAWEAFVLGNNLFDRHYANFGVLGSNDFTGPGNTYNGNGASSQFVGVGQPLGVWAGLRYRFK